MNFQNLKNINIEHFKYLENKILNNEFEVVDKIIESLDDKFFNNKGIKLLYANSKALNKKSNLLDKKKAFVIFIEIYKSNPNFIQGLYNASVLCFELQEYEEILILLEQFIDTNKFDQKFWTVLYKVYVILGETLKANNVLKEIINHQTENLEAWSALMFTSLRLDDIYQENIFELGKEFSKNLPIIEVKEKLSTKSKNNKIRVGFITPYFDGNAIDGFLLSVIKNLDKKNFEIIGFNLNKSDNKSGHLKDYFNEWYHVCEFKDYDLINFIRQKEINILIDLIGHGPRNRLSIIKNRAAPLQISWLGYINTTGIGEMDYIIADPFLIKKNEQNLYSEKILYFPKIWNSHEKLDENLEIKIPCDKNNYITFGSFNNFAKISTAVVDVWSEILFKTNSKLILKSSMNNCNDLRNRFLNKFPKKLLEENKVILIEGQKDKKKHLQIYNKIDIGLDTFPYTGVTTTFEAIWMGVPVITLKGHNFTSRCGESININCNLEEFIAEDKKDYIKKAVNFSKNIEQVKNLKKNLRNIAIKSSLFQSEEFASLFYKKLKNLWIEYKK
tara:strand:- start:376 stop:2049 length:1674 start_codon:yes stop_codon:yes gene_type:complete